MGLFSRLRPRQRLSAPVIEAMESRVMLTAAPGTGYRAHGGFVIKTALNESFTHVVATVTGKNAAALATGGTLSASFLDVGRIQIFDLTPMPTQNPNRVKFICSYEYDIAGTHHATVTITYGGFPFSTVKDIAHVAPISRNGRLLYVVAGKPFAATIGSLNSTPTLPMSINWGDGTTPDNNGTLVTKGRKILVMDLHTYTTVGTYIITVFEERIIEALPLPNVFTRDHFNALYHEQAIGAASPNQLQPNIVFNVSNDIVSRAFVNA